MFCLTTMRRSKLQLLSDDSYSDVKPVVILNFPTLQGPGCAWTFVTAVSTIAQFSMRLGRPNDHKKKFRFLPQPSAIYYTQFRMLPVRIRDTGRQPSGKFDACLESSHLGANTWICCGLGTFNSLVRPAHADSFGRQGLLTLL